ncbi:hypothetical protein [Persicimonas caeni]|nr:hypothetical protein [Persicimonas caeni]
MPTHRTIRALSVRVLPALADEGKMPTHRTIRALSVRVLPALADEGK